MPKLRVALFVEGSTDETLRGGKSALGEIWRQLAAAVGCPEFTQIVGISKKHLVALDPGLPRMSGQGEALDLLIERKLGQQAFDAAIVAWDMVPRWNPDARLCRHEEVENFYRFLSSSQRLPEKFREAAAMRHAAFVQKRAVLPYLKEGSVVALCMEPDFEAVFADQESTILASLGCQSRPKDWPSFKKVPPYGYAAVLSSCIDSARVSRIKKVPHLRTKFEAGKNSWALHFLKDILEDSAARLRLLERPPIRRLKSIADGRGGESVPMSGKHQAKTD